MLKKSQKSLLNGKKTKSGSFDRLDILLMRTNVTVSYHIKLFKKNVIYKYY